VFIFGTVPYTRMYMKASHDKLTFFHRLLLHIVDVRFRCP